MTEIAKGPITGSVLGLQRLIAESPAFQRRVELANDVLARGKVFLFDYEKPDDPSGDPAGALQRERPFAAVWPADAFDLEMVAGGAKNFMEFGGELVFLLTDYDRFPDDRQKSGLDFAGWVDEVLLDVRGGAGRDDRLNLTSITLLQSMSRPATEDVPMSGSFWHCAFLVTWG